MISIIYEGFPGGAIGKECACQCRSLKRCGFNSCLENPKEQRRLVGYSPWGHRESDRTGGT